MTNDLIQSGAECPSYCFSAMAGEFPGANSVGELWTLLTGDVTAPLRSLLPHWQVNAEAVFSAKPGTRNRVYLDQAFTLDEPAGGPSRQVRIGQRVLKQLFSEPGMNPEQLPRERIGLILATSWSDESYFQSEQGLAAGEQVRLLADQSQLGGPVLTVDTACSSVPHALEMARGLMSSQQADRVVIMAINTVLPLGLYLGFSQLTAFSADACVRAFGASANGIVPAECACAFLLEPVDQAVAAGRQPQGILTAIGLSSDGAEGSVFSPGEHAQMVAYQRAWQGLDPASVNYLETHGTATPVGDATELASVRRFFGAANARRELLTLGSIKATLGHSLAAAGGPSLAKVLLMLRHQHIPAQPAYVPSPSVENSTLNLATAAVSGPKDLQRLAISCFGFGGANAHMIIDRAVPRSPQGALPQNNGCITLNLAVMDAEAALGGAYSLAGFRHKWHQPSASGPFPAGRLAKQLARRPANGHYLAADQTIDTHGYAMGPKALDHIDPFKLLVTALTGQIIGRNSDLAHNAGTAMMMCCNMGGESYPNAYVRSECFNDSDACTAPNITVADVATMLPSMLSGYAAKIFDLRGCHQTLAGESGLLWQTLLTLPHWFDRGLEQVLLGAGRYISSHSELRHCSSDRPLQGEGAGVILLKPWQAGIPALMVLRCAVWASHASQLSDACQLAGIDPQQIDQATVCELDADYLDRSQMLYQCSGWLAEASGIEHLLQQVVALQRSGVIEVRRQGQPWLWLFSERVQPWSPPLESEPARLPYTLRFAHPEAPAPVIMPTMEAAIVQTPLAALSEQVTDTLLAALQTRSLIMQQWAKAPSCCMTSIHHVISDVHQLTEGWQATLQVNEQHPYFFDHPLDHVPGILLIAGGLQLVDQANITSLDGQFISDLHVRFMRYVDKNLPISLRLERQQVGSWLLTIRQSDQIACRIQLALSTGANSLAADTLQTVAPCCRAGLLHKHRAENVLVGELLDEQGTYSVQTAKLPDGHFFTDSDVKPLSMVYFLEIARQCYMQIAHDVLQIPLDVPMNLVTLHLTLDAPIPRQRTLRVIADKQPLLTAWLGRTNTINLLLQVGRQRLGEARIVAQVLNKHEITDPQGALKESKDG